MRYLFLFLSFSLSAMEIKEDSFPGRPKSEYESMPAQLEGAISEIHKTKSTHRIHDIETIQGTIGDTKIDIKQDKLHESDQDSNTMQVRKRTLVITHAAASLLTGIIMTGVTLAIKYGDCKK